MARLQVSNRELVSGHVQPAAADFDGSTQYLRWGASDFPIADGNSFSLVAKIRRDAVGANHILFNNNTARLKVQLQTGTNKVAAVIKDTAGAAIFGGTKLSTSTFTDSSGYFILLLSMSNTAALERLRMYTDDTQEISDDDTAVSNVAVDIAGTRNDIGADAGVTAAEHFNGCISAFWMTSEYIDWDKATYRDAVVESAGVIRNPGDDGRYWSPSNRQPEVYIPDTLNAPAVNAGSGGNPTANGTPYTACA